MSFLSENSTGTITEEDLGERFESDAVRVNKLRKKRGLEAI